MLELFDKDFKVAIIKMLQWTITIVFKTDEKTTKSQQINRKYRKETNENFRNKKHNWNNNKKCSLNGLHNRMERTEERMSELVDRIIEII